MRTLAEAQSVRSRSRDRIALATWPSSTSARINAHLRLDVDDLRSRFPTIVPVVAVGWALAQGLQRYPTLNRRVVLFRLRTNDSVRVSFAVSIDSDLQVAIIDDADTLTPQSMQRTLVGGSRAARSGHGPFARATAFMSSFPVAVSRPALRLWSLLTAGFGVPLFGFRSAPFGAALVSSVAAFGLPAVDVPFVPFARCALVVSLGAAHREAVVRGGIVEAREVIDIAVTADHRICDGAQFASFTHYVLELCGQSPIR